MPLKGPLLKKPIELVLVDDIELLINPGDATPVMNQELGYLQLVMVCPYCGRISASAGKHRYDPETKSYSPSIVHNTKRGGCGWHGYLKKGWFIDA